MVGRALPEGVPVVLDEARAGLFGLEALRGLLERALVAEPPLLVRDGGFVASGFDAELDECRRLRDEGRGVIAGMQAEYAERAGVSSLKIKHNNVLGYFIETTDTHAARMMAPPLSDVFIHRQTTANLLRFTTVELSSLETRILNAGGQAVEIEKRLYSSLKEAVLAESGALGGSRGRWRRLIWRWLWRSWRGRRSGSGRWWTGRALSESRAGGIRWWRRHCGARACRLWGMTATCRMIRSGC